MRTLGDSLRRLRAARGERQDEVAKALSVSRGTYANWEVGRNSPDPETLQRLADYFGVSVDYLLGRTDNPDRALLGVNEIVDMIAKSENIPQNVVDEALRRLAAAREALKVRHADTPSPESPPSAPLPSWFSKLPPDMQKFVEEESKHGWPYLRLARGLKMQDLTEEELRAIIKTWQDAKREHEREKGKG